MRGGFDDEIDAQRSVEAPAAPGGAAARAQRAPGGKVLARLLQAMESAGFTEQAAELVERAVAEKEQASFLSHAVQFTAAPSKTPALAEVTKRRSAATKPPTSPTASADAAASPAPAATATNEQIGSLYLDAARHLAPPDSGAPKWRSLGPWTIPNGQTYGASRVHVSGRISSVAIDPGDPSHVLVGAANGGVWQSRDGGDSWQPRTDEAATLAVGALAFDPSNPSTVYCGTGEGNAIYILGAGILRSTDGGTSWSTLCTDPFVGKGFHSLVVDPQDGQHLLAATSAGKDTVNVGLFRSTDGGVNWTHLHAAKAWSLSVAPGGGPNAEVLAGCEDGLHRSVDGGATWTTVSLPQAPSTFTRLAVAIAPSDPSIAYAWGAGPPSVRDPRVREDVPTAYLWRRAQGNWTLEANGAAGAGSPPNVFTSQAWYDWFLAVAPDRDTQVFLGSIEIHRGDYANGGWTWQNISNQGHTGDSIHADQHAVAFVPGDPDTLYVGNDGGLFRSPDRGSTWEHRNNGLEITEFEYLAQDLGSSRWILGGTQDNGTQRWLGGRQWEHVADGDGGDCGVNPTDPRTVFHTYYGMSPRRSRTRGAFGSWAKVFPPVPSREGSLFYPPLECSADGGDTIAIGGDALYVSRDNGDHWKRLSFSVSSRSSAMFIGDRDNVLVGTTSGRIFKTQWNGQGWSALSELTTPRADAFVSDLMVDPANSSRIWATYRRVGGGRVFRSDDAGASWHDCTAGLPELPLNAIQLDPHDASRVWVAADVGVYESKDAGGSWTDFSNGLPNMLVGDLLFHPHARVLRAGTRSRGVWEIPVDGWMTEPTTGVQWRGDLGANESRRWYTSEWPATWHVLWSVVPTTNGNGEPQVSWNVQVERAGPEYVTYWVTVTNSTAAPVAVEARYAILSLY